jgi:hypothetical protein
MLVLLGFAAIAVDGGLILQERRQDQNAADAAALSAGLGARVAPTQTGCLATGTLEQTAACNGAVIAIDTVLKNLDTPLTEADFADNVRCGNAAFPNEYHIGGSSTGVAPETASNTIYCIRFTENLDKVRVVLPLINVDTTFGRVLGRDQVPVSAVAEADLTFGGPGSILPFAVGPTGAGASHACVFEPGPGINGAPCDGPVDGNFGYLMSYLYGDTVLGTPIACGSGGGYPDPIRIAASIAKGSDHFFLTDLLVPGTANDLAECPNKNQPIDEVDVRTGGFTNAAQVGLFESALGTEGRLLCKSPPTDPDEPLWLDPPLESENNGTDCEEVGATQHSEFIDDTDLWEFLNSGIIETVPASACNSVGSTSEMTNCLDAWKQWEIDNSPTPHGEDLFDPDIATSPRFGWVPLLNADPNSGGSGFYLITDFQPVDVWTSYFKCSGPNSCDAIFTPSANNAGTACSGIVESCGWPYNGNKDIDGQTAFMIPRTALPSPLSDFPFDQDQVTYNLSE